MYNGEQEDLTCRSATFLRSVFLGHEKGFVVIFRRPSMYSTFTGLTTQDWYTNAARQAMLSREKEDIYFAVGIQEKPPATGRGKEAGVAAIPGLWADIDVLGPNHAATNLPPTLDDAWKIV